VTDILIIDDEISIRKVVSAYLEAEGFTVYTAEDGQGALALFRRYRPGVVVLDIMLPGMDGLEVLQHIRRESNVYVLMLTAKSEETDRVIGLTVGADDYMTKPFSPRELVARVKALLRRERSLLSSEDEPVLQFANLCIDVKRHEVWRNGILIELTALEFKILAVLAQHMGQVLSREQLIERVWGYDAFLDDRTVDVHIRRIRHKLEVDPLDPQFILTVRGVGYKFGDKMG
jgi:two-component system alkaline phosphatase synthesis response regulator PhoP